MADLTLPFNLKTTGNFQTDMTNVATAARSTTHGDKTRTVTDAEVDQIWAAISKGGVNTAGAAVNAIGKTDPELETLLKMKAQGY